jgi:hypothetical protein
MTLSLFVNISILCSRGSTLLITVWKPLFYRDRDDNNTSLWVLRGCATIRVLSGLYQLASEYALLR